MSWATTVAPARAAAPRRRAWGLAYASGPNYNKQWDAFDERDLLRSLRQAREATVRAAELARDGSPLQRDLIRALDARYPPVLPDDLDVAALHADALMNVTAWSLWDLGSGQPAEGARTREAQTVLETAMRRPGGMTHPGILHFYIP